eukprot:CAMPEP_0119391970 /NCGR_PEP_ID=MMETSP1334-20130426/119355_1 /TAXON_ID=127549 /ORGANISM="Calcidiscus leptoporus, Strain RCC1130" /LENGTH=79 /DNA_ID=CAMNT_0007414749 /DNA_START=68 /DNA_END=307 /DNA_ORIENTATION=-
MPRLDLQQLDGHHRLDRLPREHPERRVVREPRVHPGEFALATSLELLFGDAVNLPAAAPLQWQGGGKFGRTCKQRLAFT